MRVLVHPALDDITLQGVLYALSDPMRLQIFADIDTAGAERTCASFLVVNSIEIPKSTLSQHFRILRECGLIRSERKGVEMLSVSRRTEIEARFPGLLPAILSAKSRAA